jgi:hypothetical protein
MQSLREHILLKSFWFLTALQILNCSVDAPDLMPEHIAENLKYNEMESVIEIVLEKGLEIKNAIPEHDDNDNGNDRLTLKKGMDLFSHYSIDVSPLASTAGLKFLLNNDKFSAQFHPELVSPPPKV